MAPSKKNSYAPTDFLTPPPSKELDYLDSLQFMEDDEDGSLSVLESQTTPEEDTSGNTTVDELDLDALLDGNLAETFLADEYLEELEERIEEGFTEDLESLEDHYEVLKKGIDILGIKLEDSGALGDWSCGASHPLIIENAIKFQANVVNELDNADTLVKTKIVGLVGDDKAEQRANRVGEFMNYYIPDRMDQFFSESAKCALGTSLMGTGFKKTVWNSTTEAADSRYLRIDQVITNWETKTLETATRYTEICPSNDIDIVRGMTAGVYRKIDLENSEKEGQGEETYESKKANLFVIGEYLKEITGVSYENERVLAYHYTYLDVKEMMKEANPSPEGQFDSEAEEESLYYEKQYLPFIVIQELVSGKILGVYGNWKAGDTTYKPKEYITDYHFIRGFGFYSLGYIHVLGNFAKMLTSIMRSLVDAGTFATIPGGFRLRGSKIAGDVVISPGEFIEVESAVQDISKAIMALPFKEPSAVLTQMYSVLENRGQMFANATEGVVSGATNYGPVGTTMALLDASSKLSTSIIRDFHRSRRREFKTIYRLLSENMPEEYPYEVTGQQKTIFKEDFADNVQVLPVSDPNIPSQAQRMAVAQQKLQIAQQFPQVHNIREALKDVYRAMGEQNPDRLLPQSEEPQPLDPMGDFLAASQNKPIRAFPGQDHQAHISFKQAILGNPQYAQSEFLQGTLQALSANIREHMVLDIAEKMKAATGTDPGPEVPGKAVAQAQAMQQLSQMAQQLAQLQQNAVDPAMLLAQSQVEKTRNDAKRIESQEVRDFAKLALEKEKVEIEKKKLEATSALGENKIKADLIKHDQKMKGEAIKASKDSLDMRANKAIDLLGKAAITEGTLDHQKELEHIRAQSRATSSKPKKK